MSKHDRPFAPKSETEDWKLNKACLPASNDVDELRRISALFFPERGVDADIAKRICEGCTVRRECLTYALTPPIEAYGIWGGTSGRERRKLTLAAITDKPLPPIRFFADAIVEATANRTRKGGRFVADEAKPLGRPPQPINHGTTAGYRAHLRRYEIACDECRDAHKAASHASYVNSKQRRQRDREAIAATVVEIGPRRKTGRILEGVTA